MQPQSALAFDEEEEIRTLAIPSATIVWSGPYSIAEAARKSRSGLYVVASSTRPIYVGQTSSFKSRFTSRLRVLRQIGCDISGRKVYLGSIQLPAGGGKSAKLRLDLESALIRSYSKRGQKLANRSSIRQFRMGPKDAIILNKGSLPPQMKREIALKRNQLFELDFGDGLQEAYGDEFYEDKFDDDGFNEPAELELEMFDGEEGELRRKRRSPASRQRKSFAARTRSAHPRSRSGRRIRRNRPRPLILRRPRSTIRQSEPCICPTGGTELVRWVQSALNQISGLRLSVNGLMNRATREALRDFQKQEGLPVDGIAGPETKQALIAARSG